MKVKTRIFGEVDIADEKVLAFDNGIIKPGQLVLYPAFGSGLTWGAALIRV